LLSFADNDEKVESTIIGGSALVLLNLSAESRMTTDIDVMEAAIQAEALLGQYDMNQHATTFQFRLPENWKERRQRVPFDGVVLEVYAPSNEDLAILKLDANRPVDRADLREMIRSGRLDIDKLLAIVQDDVEIRIGFDDDEEWLLFLERVNELVTISETIEDKK
jgi:hypothetical protein